MEHGRQKLKLMLAFCEVQWCAFLFDNSSILKYFPYRHNIAWVYSFCSRVKRGSSFLIDVWPIWKATKNTR